jgi:hypothetical protein
VHTWPYADQKLAYVAPPVDDNFTVEILAGGDPLPIPEPVHKDLGGQRPSVDILKGTSFDGNKVFAFRGL